MGADPSADHPRSRGVDAGRRIGDVSRVGSSPLARGRLLPGPIHEPGHRIIPARAGSTPHGRRLLPRGGGSSPLARGRHHPEKELIVTQRIIPARAGSTVIRVAGMPYGTDHPRSRGVDWHNFGIRVNSGGSSPLARGRHGVRPGVSAPRWIIPARAGSTCSTWPRRPREPDHPRSRGVDTVMSHCPGVAPGSSPLARGRLVSGGGASDESGIIPARAGSTLQRVWAWVTGTDHPRSRGVDLMPFMAVDTADGSSPLARGRR